MSKARVDVLLCERGLAPSRARAQALILAGKVFSGERRIDKAGQVVDREAPLHVRGPDHPYVSRGGAKLAGALRELGLDPRGWDVADFGASTGGFTDCLLQHGARSVYAIDVGYGQLHPALRDDPRVVVRERTNARYLNAEELGAQVDLVVIDASFIGLDKLLPAAVAVLRPAGQVLALVKPQFEAGAAQVGRGGVVRDARVRGEAVERVLHDARARGLACRARADSEVEGPKGNLETFVWLERR